MAFVAMGVGLCNYWVLRASRDRMFDRVEDVPARPVALVLGTARRVGPYENLYFTYRIEAAAVLYHAGKVRHLLVSGDNHRHGYNEPEDMQAAWIERGVPASAITKDYAGFRTLDSIVPAKEVFGQRELVIVSGQFHNYRALFLCRRHGIDAVAYNARVVPASQSVRTYIREWFARVKAVLDVYVLWTRPHFLGPAIPLPVGEVNAGDQK